MKHTRTYTALLVAGTLLIAQGSKAPAAPLSGLSHIDGVSTIELVQDKPKPETIKHRAKRIWRNLTGYKFDVACPAFAFALSRTTCTETGKDREAARAKCQAQHTLCQVWDAKR